MAVKTPAKTETSRELSTLDAMDQLFDKLFHRSLWQNERMSSLFDESIGAFKDSKPKINLSESKKAFIIEAELPGVEKDDIKIDVNTNSVTIKADTRREEKEEKEDYYHHEIQRSSFFRSIALPSEVNPDEVKAKFKNGLLKLTLPKSKNGKQRTISIE